MKILNVLSKPIGLSFMMLSLCLSLFLLHSPLFSTHLEGIPMKILNVASFIVFAFFLIGFGQTGAMRKLFMVGISLLAIAVIMKILHLKAADIMLIISFFLVAISFVGHFFLAKDFSILKITQLLFVLCILAATIFRLLHLFPTSDVILLTVAHVSGIVHLLVRLKVSIRVEG